MNSAPKPAWKKPQLREIPVFMEVSLYANGR
ncbi:MAG TPA: pyrroloquinoline quinone precursor peptide PqqA [Candidatus Methylacidiphilales bacterium]